MQYSSKYTSQFALLPVSLEQKHKMKCGRNILGGTLKPCCFKPLTGFFRDGLCRTGAVDSGTHVVCAVMTEEFLSFTRARGNDLITPLPYFNFPGLKPGDRWCLCASRWRQAYREGTAPPVILEATHEKALEILKFEWLLEHKFSEV